MPAPAQPCSGHNRSRDKQPRALDCRISPWEIIQARANTSSDADPLVALAGTCQVQRVPSSLWSLPDRQFLRSHSLGWLSLWHSRCLHDDAIAPLSRKGAIMCLSCSGHFKQGLAGIPEHYLLPLLWSTGKEPFSSDCIPHRPQPRPGGFAYEPVACQGPGRASPSKSPTRNQEGGRSSATYRKVSPHHSGNLLQVTAILQRARSPLAMDIPLLPCGLRAGDRAKARRH